MTWRVFEKIVMVWIHVWGPFWPFNMIAGYVWFFWRGIRVLPTR